MARPGCSCRTGLPRHDHARLRPSPGRRVVRATSDAGDAHRGSAVRLASAALALDREPARPLWPGPRADAVDRPGPVRGVRMAHRRERSCPGPSQRRRFVADAMGRATPPRPGVPRDRRDLLARRNLARAGQHPPTPPSGPDRSEPGGSLCVGDGLPPRRLDPVDCAPSSGRATPAHGAHRAPSPLRGGPGPGRARRSRSRAPVRPRALPLLVRSARRADGAGQARSLGASDIPPRVVPMELLP